MKLRTITAAAFAAALLAAGTVPVVDDLTRPAAATPAGVTVHTVADVVRACPTVGYGNDGYGNDGYGNDGYGNGPARHTPCTTPPPRRLPAPSSTPSSTPAATTPPAATTAPARTTPGTLPVTGTRPALVAGAGLLLLIAGGAAIRASRARRRRHGRHAQSTGSFHTNG